MPNIWEDSAIYQIERTSSFKILATKLYLLGMRSTETLVESWRAVCSEYNNFSESSTLSHESFVMVEKFLLPKKARQKVSPRVAGLEVSAHPTPSQLKATSDLNNCLLSRSPLSLKWLFRHLVATPKDKWKQVFQDIPRFFTYLAMTALHKKAMKFGIYL